MAHSTVVLLCRRGFAPLHAGIFDSLAGSAFLASGCCLLASVSPSASANGRFDSYIVRRFDSFAFSGFAPLHVFRSERVCIETRLWTGNGPKVALEATQFFALYFDNANITRLHHYVLEVQLGIADIPNVVTLLAICIATVK